MAETAIRLVDEATSVQTIDSYENFVARVGVMNNNVLSAGFYGFNLLTRNRVQLEAAYRGSWIVGQMVNAVAEDMTKAGISLSSKLGDTKKAMRQISRLGIGNSLCQLIAWARLYGGAIAVMQIDGQDPETPLDPSTVAKGQFKGLVVYDRWQINPVLTDVIRKGPEMGLPRYYDIVTGWTSGDPDTVTSSGTLRVHHSRVIRAIGIELPYFQAITEMMWGESELERLWDRLLSFDNTTMSSANLVERANNRTVKVEKLRNIIAAGGAAMKGLEKQFEMMREFQTNEGLTLLDKEDEFHVDVYTFSGLDSVLIQFGQQLAGACGIPLVRLFGQSPAGLSATGDADLRTYYDNINSKQNARLTSPWERILSVLWPSTFGEKVPDDLDFEFVPLWQMSDLDRAQVNQANTQSVCTAYEAGLISRPTAMKELRNQSGASGLFSNITEDDIKEAEDSDEPPMADPADDADVDTTPDVPEEKPKIGDNLKAKVKAWLSRSR